MKKRTTIYTPNLSEFPTPDAPKNAGNPLEGQSIVNSPMKILADFHGDGFVGYSMTPAAGQYGFLLYERKEGNIDAPTLKTLVSRTFFRAGLEQSGDNQNTIEGNSTKFIPALSNRSKEYPFPKWRFKKSALQYLFKITATVEKEIAAERKSEMETLQEQTS